MVELNKEIGTLGKVSLSIVAFSVARYLGFQLLLAFGASTVVWWVANKRFTSKKRALCVPAFSVQLGHLFWLMLGVLYLGKLDANTIDIVVMTVGLMWLMAKPSIYPIVFLCLFQILGASVNAFMFMETTVGSMPYKALLVHLVFRIVACFLMMQAYFKLKNL